MVIPKGSPPVIFPIAFLVFVLGLAVPFPLDAQQTNAPVDESVSDETQSKAAAPTSEKQYRVEVIVFNYLGPISSNGEIWHRVSPIEFSPESYRPAPVLQSEDSIESTNESNNPIEFTELKILLPYLSKLHSDSRYEVVTYTAWIQPLYEKKESVRVQLTPSFEIGSTNEIDTFTQPTQPTLIGGIQLFENRLLFVDIDIKNDFNPRSVNFSDSSFDEKERPFGTHRIQEKRRVKLNELHYFDHPFFGALVRVSREEP